VSLACDLSGGRSLALAPEVRADLRCGVVELSGVRVDHGSGAAEQTRLTAARYRELYAGSAPSNIAPLGAARTLYKSFGMDPSRHRPSSEALLRRVLKGLDLYRINSAVDCCNLASLEFLLPVGMYDAGRIQGDVSLRLGREGDSYAGIRKGDVNVGGRLALYDDLGPFGSPTSDSARTCVEERTKEVLAVIFAPATYASSAMRDHLELFGALFATHCMATIGTRQHLGWENES